jgi:hypothetical protein
MRPEGLDQLVKLNYITGSRTRDLLARSLVPDPRAPHPVRKD